MQEERFRMISRHTPFFLKGKSRQEDVPADFAGNALHFRRDLLEWSHNEGEEEKEYLQCSESGLMGAGQCREGVSELLPEPSRAAINEGGLQGQ